MPELGSWKTRLNPVISGDEPAMDNLTFVELGSVMGAEAGHFGGPIVTASLPRPGPLAEPGDDTIGIACRDHLVHPRFSARNP